MLRAARRRVVEVAEECDPCRVLDAARAGHEGREGLREEELVDAREVAHERERRRVDPLRVDGKYRGVPEARDASRVATGRLRALGGSARTPGRAAQGAGRGWLCRAAL